MWFLLQIVRYFAAENTLAVIFRITELLKVGAGSRSARQAFAVTNLQTLTLFRAVLEDIPRIGFNILPRTENPTAATTNKPVHPDGHGSHQCLRRLKAKEGVVSIMGNHDFFIYSPEYRDNGERSAAADRLTRLEEDSLGWRVVRNSHIMLRRGGDSITIAGVDNTNGGEGFATIQKGDLKRATEGLKGVFTVMMTHDPSHWRAEVLPCSEAQLTLSGHTHAAQFRIFGWSLANLFFSECDGRYDEGERTLYVNAGIGCTAPFRIDCPSEITVITLTAP